MAFRIRYSSRAAPGAATAVLLLSFLAPTSQTSFLYTYKLPTVFTDGAKLPIDRSENPWTTWYDVDQVKCQARLPCLSYVSTPML